MHIDRNSPSSISCSFISIRSESSFRCQIFLYLQNNPPQLIGLSPPVLPLRNDVVGKKNMLNKESVHHGTIQSRIRFRITELKFTVLQLYCNIFSSQ